MRGFITRWRRLSFDAKLTITVTIVVALVTGVVVPVLLHGGSNNSDGTTQAAGTGTSIPVGQANGTTQAAGTGTSIPAGQANAPATKYLWHLTPTAGDTPMGGDAQISDQDFRKSIFYDNIPSNQSNASACQNVADPTCRATVYSIANTRYRHFSAMLGVTGCSGDTAKWSLTVDSTTIVRSRPVQVNGPPQRVSETIPSGNSLALLVSSSGFSGAACGGVDIVWGDAQLS